MDSVDLIARENEFKKLNKQLEKKTESLIKQIERDMQKRDFFSDIPQNISLHRPSSVKKHCCDTPSSSPKSTPTKTKNKVPAKSAVKTAVEPQTSRGHGCVSCEHCAKDHSVERWSMDTEFLYAFVNVNVQDKVLPASFMKELSLDQKHDKYFMKVISTDTISLENVCKFLGSKVKLLQEQIEKLQTTIEKKAAQCEKHFIQLSNLETERLSFINNKNNLTAEISNARAKCAALQIRLTEKDRLCEKQRSDIDRLGSRVRELEKSDAGAEGRCAALERAAEKLKTELASARMAEKDFRTASRELSNSHQSAISRLESRIKTLTSRIDKQAALIDNLKRQNSLLTAEGAVKYLEKEYLNFLNKDF